MGRNGERVGFYSGSFDPVTYGHLDIIGRSFRVVDHVVVGIGVSATKKPTLSFEERARLIKEETAEMAREAGGRVSVVPFQGLVVDAAHKAGAKIIIRGLRGPADYEYEAQMVGMNGILAPDVETVFLTAAPGLQIISSTLVRQIAAMGGELEKFVPPSVAKALHKRFEEED